MGYFAMAKVVAFLCVALFLVATTVESARVLKQYDAPMTAETFNAEVFTDVPYNYNAAPVTQEAIPPPVDTAFPPPVEAEVFTDVPYNYNAAPVTEEASVDEGVFATEGVLVGETTPGNEESYVFDALHEDGPVFDATTTTQGFDDTLADQDATSLALDTSPEFEFQETPDENGGGPGIFAFDESAPAFAP